MDYKFEIENFIKDFEKNCSKTIKKKFLKNEIITSYIRKRHQVCILLKGSADLVRYDRNGDRFIIDHFLKNDIFR